MQSTIITKPSYSTTPWVLNVNKKPEALLRLFCFHYAGGSASVFRSWSEHLPSSVELVAIQFPGREGRYTEKYIEQFDKLIDHLAENLTPFLDRPYVVFGHSLGSLVGFEWITESRRRKLLQPELFIASGRKAPHLPEDEDPITHLPEEEFVEELLKDYSDKLESILSVKELRDMFIPQIRADFALSETYEYKEREEFNFPVIAFGGVTEKNLSESDLLAWGKHTNNDFRSKRFPGEHFFIHDSEELLLQTVNEELKSVLKCF